MDPFFSIKMEIVNDSKSPLASQVITNPSLNLLNNEALAACAS